MADALRGQGRLVSRNLEVLLQAIVCDTKSATCMNQHCVNCSNKSVVAPTAEENRSMRYYQWGPVTDENGYTSVKCKEVK